jgi:GTPase SAR1 family protein
MHANFVSPPLSNSDPDDEELRSYFDGITKGCDVFRILLVGKSGSGKSTLVSEVFDFDLDNANVQHFSVSPAEVRAGSANTESQPKSGDHDINQEITSGNNKSLSLHDSKGLESGSSENLKIITDFIQDRKGRPFAEQLHAIWFDFRPSKYNSF